MFVALSLFSAVGALFMLMVATLLTRQPFFLGGFPDFDQARGAAYGAMWAYIVTFGICIILMIRDARKSHREHVIMRSNYGQVPQLDIQDYDVEIQDLPLSVNEGVYTEGNFT